MFNDYLYEGYGIDCDWNAEGGNKLWLVKQDNIGNVLTDDNGLVTSVELLNSAAWVLFDKLNDLEYTITPSVRSRNGVTHACSISFTDPRITSIKSDVYLRMSSTDLAVVFQDNNGLLWLFGEEQPMKVSALKLSSDGNAFTVTLSNQQKKKFRQSATTL